MGLDIFFHEDIRNALRAANEASAQTAAMVATLQPKPGTGELRAFRDGFQAALITIALAFGLQPETVIDLPVGGEVLAPVETQKGPGIEETKAAR